MTPLVVSSGSVATRCFRKLEARPMTCLAVESKFKAKIESRLSYFSFKALNSRRFHRGFDKFNLYRLTWLTRSAAESAARLRP
jgi:hypothetical protein